MKQYRRNIDSSRSRTSANNDHKGAEGTAGGDPAEQRSQRRKEPKKARTVEIPEDRRLDEKTYNELANHAKNSGIYYCTTSAKSKQEIREKLTAKGYVEEDITVYPTPPSEDKPGSTDSHNVFNAHTAGKEFTANIIEDTIRHLELLVLLDDKFLARNIVESMLHKGKGAQEMRRKLREKKIDPDIAEEHINALNDNTEGISAAIEKAVLSYQRKSAYRKEQDEYKRQQKLFSFLMGRGFSTDQIKNYLDDRAQEELEEHGF